MTRLLTRWKRWAALGAAFFLVLLLWLSLVAVRVAGEPLPLCASHKAAGEGT